MYCHDCGQQVADATNFCRHCGVRLGFAPAQAAEIATAVAAAMPQPDFEHVAEPSANDPQSPLQLDLPVTEAAAVIEPPQPDEAPQSDADSMPSFAPESSTSVRLHPMFLVAGLATAVVIVGGIGAYLALSHRAGAGNAGENVARSADGQKGRAPDAGVPQTRNSIADTTRRAAIAAAIAADAKQTENERVRGKVPDAQVQQKNSRQSASDNVKQAADEKKPPANTTAAPRTAAVNREPAPRRPEANAPVAAARPQVADRMVVQAPPKVIAQDHAASDSPKLQMAAQAERSHQAVCAESPNLFSREICLWRECEKPEFRQTADCARFSRSAN